MTLALTGKTPRRRTALVLAAFFAIIGASLGGLWAVNTAFAHHAIITGTATCESDGTYTITWAVANSQSDKYMWIDNSGTDAVTVNVGAISSVQTTMIATSGSGQVVTTAPGNTTGSVYLTLSADWYSDTVQTNGHYRGGPFTNDGANATYGTPVTLDGTCVPVTGKIQVHKYLWDPDAKGGAGDWKPNAQGGQRELDFHFTLAEIQGSSFEDIEQGGGSGAGYEAPVGAYTLSEILPAPGGYQFVDFFNAGNNGSECLNPKNAPTGPADTGTNSVSVTVSGNNTTHVCAYDAPPPPPVGFIEVYKVVTNVDGDTTAFDANIDGGTSFTFTEMAFSGNHPVPIGAHTVTELAETGYNTLGWALGTPGGNPVCPAAATHAADSSAEIEVVEQNTKIVCFYNEKVVPGFIEVYKVVTNVDSDATLFDATIDGGTSFTFSEMAFSGNHPVPVGAHTVTELAETGYVTKGWALATGDPKNRCPADLALNGTDNTAEIDVASNNTTIVCFYNEKALGHIEVHKVVTNVTDDTTVFDGDYGGQTSFTFSEAGSPGYYGSNQVAAGPYTVTEHPETGYTTKGWALWTMDPKNPCPATWTSDTGDNTAEITVVGGSTRVLCFYNEKIPTYQVHIAKFIGAVHATEANAGNAEFPMTAVWKDIGGGIPDGSWPYTLSKTPNGGTVPFEAETRELLAGADYSTYETLGACSLAQPYELVGYTTSSTGFDTNPMHITTAVPSFTDIQGDQYVVVWNKPCLGSVIIHKVVEIGSSVNPDDTNPEFTGTFESKLWTLSDGEQVVSVGVPAGGNYVVTENPGTVGQPGDTSWRKPLFLAPNSAGVCPTTSVGATTLDPDHITVVGGVTTTVCVLNHRNQPSDLTATVNVIKVVTGSVATTDTFEVALTTDAFKGGGGTASLAGGTGHLFSIGLDSDHHDAVFSVSETPRAGYTLLGYKLLVGGQGCPAPGGTYLTSVTDIPIGIASQQAYTVCVYNEPLVNITVHKTEQNGLITQDGAGWKVTLSGCGMTPRSATTDAFGNAKFEKLPLCATYLVSEDLTSRAPLMYVVAGGYQATYTVSATTAGQTYSVLFANVLWSPPPYCEVYDCTPPKTQETPETATPETPTETATAPVVVTTPTSPPAKTEIVEGEKTPGQQATPIAPETGSGSGDGSGMNIVLAGLGLAAVSLGLGTMALGKRRTR